MVEPPLGAPSVGEDLGEQLAGLRDAEEVLLVGRLLVGVGGRELDLVDLHLVVEIGQHVDHVLRAVVVEEGGVGAHPEARGLGRGDRLDRLVEGTGLLHHRVVPLTQPVDVDDEGEVRRRCELRHLLPKQQSVGAQQDKLLAGNELTDDLVELRVHQRLTTGDRHHRRAALLHRGHGVLDAHPLLENGRRVLDLAATGA